MRIIKTLIIGVLAVCAQSAYGLGLHYIRNLEETSYGVFGQTWQIVEFGADHQFFANHEGVFEYDGAEWMLYPMNNRGDCRSVFADYENGRVLVGGINEFGYLKPGPTGELEYTCLNDSVPQSSTIGNVWGIHSHDGTIYLQGDGAVLKYNELAGTSRVTDSPAKLNRSVFVKGILYLATDEGLMMMIGDHIIHAYGSEELEGKRVRVVVPYGDGVIAITSDAKAYAYDDQQLTCIELGFTLPNDEVYSADMRDNLLAIGTISSGVIVVDLASGEVEQYNEVTGLYNNTVQSLMFDGDGNLWTGMDTGAAYIMLAHPITNLLPTSRSIGSGYAIMPYGDKLYLGTNRGLYYVPYNQATNHLTDPAPREVPGLAGQVWAITEIDGDLLCMHDRGLYRIRDDRAEQISAVGAWSMLPFYSGGRTRAWVGDYLGIIQIERVDGEWHINGRVKGQSGSASNMTMVRPEEIWIHDGLSGLTCIEINMRTLQVKKRNEYAGARFKWAKEANVRIVGDEVVFASPEGIYRYDRQTDSIVADEATNRRLIGKTQYLRLFEDRGKYLYAVTPSEVMRTVLSDPGEPLHIIPQISRRIKPMFDGKSLCMLNDSTMVYPNFTGYSVYNFASDGIRRVDNHNYARIHKVIEPRRGGKLLYRSNFCDSLPKIEIPYSRNSLAFSYGKALAERKRLIHYRYRLDNEEWSPFVTTHAKEYSNLGIGEHTFYVEAHTTDGIVYSDSFKFRVLTPWYMSVWAICVYVLLLIGGLTLALYGAQRMMARKQARIIEEKETEIEHQREHYERESEIKDEKIHNLEHEKLQVELDHKSQEIVNLLLSVSSKNETLIALKDEIQRVAARTGTPVDTRRALMVVQSRIDDSLRSETVLKRVEEEFDLLHNDFMKKLQARYPSLTNNELVMCAYIKMNLSTKEIAPLLNISTRGVETMRYRLRKKFDLSREDNLIEFLSREM